MLQHSTTVKSVRDSGQSGCQQYLVLWYSAWMLAEVGSQRMSRSILHCNAAGMCCAEVSFIGHNARVLQLAEDLKRAKDAGWNDPTPFKYEAVPDGEAGEPDNRDSAPWLSDAAVYQWDDEFGEVGQPQPELEKMLFADDNIQRRGGHLNALSFEVNLEGPLKVQPVREVSDSVRHIIQHC